MHSRFLGLDREEGFNLKPIGQAGGGGCLGLAKPGYWSQLRKNHMETDIISNLKGRILKVVT